MAESRICSIDGCGNKRHAKGMCASHYARFVRHGTPHGGGTGMGEARRFLDYAASFQSDECLLWPFSSIGPNGYARAELDGRAMNAHRAVCELAHGVPQDDSLVAAHSCRNRACVNPRHLRWATVSENQADRVRDNTSNRGERCAAAHLTEVDVRNIKSLLAHGQKTRIVAEKFGVHDNTVRDIKFGRTWAWLN